jgi:hypothetical protein
MEQKYLDDAEKSKWQKLQEKKSKWQKLQDGEWESSLRITGTDAPARQLMSESGRMRLEARKLRRAGDKEGSNQLLRMAAAEKIAGEPTVKSQAFVDASEEAKNQPSPQSFSFDQDIAPMRGSFFQSNLSGRENSYLQNKYGPDIDDAKDMLDIQSKKNSIRNSDLTYQMNLESLQKRRDDAARERDIQSRVPDLINQINGIRNGEGDSMSKAAALTGLQMENPYVSGTKLGAAMMGAAFNNLDYQARAQIKRDNEAEKERLKEKARLAPYAGAGAVDKVTEMIDVDGVRTQDEQDAFEFATYVRDAAKDTATQKQGSAERTGFLKSQNALVTTAYDALDSITFEKPSTDYDPSITGQPAPPSGFTKESRRELERSLARLKRTTPSKIRKQALSDDDLEDAVFTAVNNLQVGLQEAQFSSIDNTTPPPNTPQNKTKAKWRPTGN